MTSSVPHLTTPAQAKEYLDDHWIFLQVKVIPFTTLIDAKRETEQLLRSLGIMIFFTEVPAFVLFHRAWMHLDGFAGLAKGQFTLLLPQIAAIFIFAATAASLSIAGVEVSTFATPVHAPTLVAVSVLSFLVVLACFAAMIGALFWGSHHSANVLALMIVAPPSIFALIAGITLIARAGEVEDFVTPRWEDIKNFVPIDYQSLPASTYVLDSATLMRQAGLAALVQGLLGVVFLVIEIPAIQWQIQHTLGRTPGAVTVATNRRLLQQYGRGKARGAGDAGALGSADGVVPGQQGTTTGGVGSGSGGDGGGDGKADSDGSGSGSGSDRRGSEAVPG